MSRWLSILLALALAGGTLFATLFATANQGGVTLNFPGGWRVEGAPLFAVVFLSVCGGFLLGAAIGWLNGVRYRRRALMAMQQCRSLEEELRNLRNLPLQSDIHL